MKLKEFDVSHIITLTAVVRPDVGFATAVTLLVVRIRKYARILISLQLGVQTLREEMNLQQILAQQYFQLEYRLPEKHAL